MNDDSLALRVRAFVDEVVIPAESQVHHDAHPTETLRLQLQAAAREHGVFAPHAPTGYGGLGLSAAGQALVFEEAGRSLLGPLALNCAAPDEGNTHLLDKVATPEQRERYLGPLATGQVRSAFAMTEPPPGAGSDPDALRTIARRTEGGWVIDGEKWFITGAVGAAFAIVMARTGEGRAATMLLVDTGNPGLTVVREPASLDRGFVGGHAHLRLEDCHVPDDAVLGEVHEGFRYAQVRLAPARLTHCMRWLGIAARAHDIALDYVAERQVFGSPLGELGMAQAHLADSEIDLAASRALVARAAAALDAGRSGGEETSIAKTFVAEAVNRVVDRAVQLCGSHGISHDRPLALFLREVRPFRIYDGPSEVHRMSLAKRALRRRARERGDAA